MEHKVEYLNASLRRSVGPILPATKEFFPGAAAACKPHQFQGQEWFCGSGIRPADHPMRNEMRALELGLDQADCLYCESKDVYVIALQGCVSMHSGDAYYDFELRCNQCEKFSVYSYAEN